MEWILGILTVVLPVITGAVTWLAAGKKRKNDFLSNLQSSIDLLSQKYTEALNELAELRRENLELRSLQQKLILEVTALKEENAALRKEVEYLNEKLSNVKTITRTK